MTNEQLAGFIKQGGNDELIPLLWERVRKLMHMLSNRYFAAYSDRLTACGITAEDIRTASYFAFLRAVDGFNEKKGFKFASYLRYPLKNEVRRMITKDSLNNAESLNEPIGNDSDPDRSELIDLIPDQSAFDFVDRVERDSLCGAVRAAVAKLDPEYREYINKRFYKGTTYKEIAAERGTSLQAVRQYESNLMHKLRQNEDFIRINKELHLSSLGCALYKNSYSFYKNSGMTAFERYVISAADREAEYREMLRNSREETRKLAEELGISLPDPLTG